MAFEGGADRVPLQYANPGADHMRYQQSMEMQQMQQIVQSHLFSSHSSPDLRQPSAPNMEEHKMAMPDWTHRQDVLRVGNLKYFFLKEESHKYDEMKPWIDGAFYDFQAFHEYEENDTARLLYSVYRKKGSDKLVVITKQIGKVPDKLLDDDMPPSKKLMICVLIAVIGGAALIILEFAKYLSGFLGIGSGIVLISLSIFFFLMWYECRGHTFTWHISTSSETETHTISISSIYCVKRKNLRVQPVKLNNGLSCRQKEEKVGKVKDVAVVTICYFADNDAQNECQIDLKLSPNQGFNLHRYLISVVQLKI